MYLYPTLQPKARVIFTSIPEFKDENDFRCDLDCWVLSTLYYLCSCAVTWLLSSREIQISVVACYILCTVYRTLRIISLCFRAYNVSQFSVCDPKVCDSVCLPGSWLARPRKPAWSTVFTFQQAWTSTPTSGPCTTTRSSGISPKSLTQKGKLFCSFLVFLFNRV